MNKNNNDADRNFNGGESVYARYKSRENIFAKRYLVSLAKRRSASPVWTSAGVVGNVDNGKREVCVVTICVVLFEGIPCALRGTMRRMLKRGKSPYRLCVLVKLNRVDAS
jgi:hypothetical protein